LTNTANGYQALFRNTTGNGNTGVGAAALSGNINGNLNTGVGAGALALNNANGNTAVGSAALAANTSGDDDTGVGSSALLNNTHGNKNTAVGADALNRNTFGSGNTANGSSALNGNTTGFDNTAVGDAALRGNIKGNENTGVGSGALQLNNASHNTAVGLNVLRNNTTGGDNTAIGGDALDGNTTGSNNIAVGDLAGGSLTTGSDNIDIGNEGHAAEANTIRIGTPFNNGIGQNKTFISGIRGETTQMANAMPVVIDSAGQLGTANSSRRYKTDIKPMEKASESILALKPVSFRYKVHKDSTPQFGLIAEEVAQVNPDLVIYDSDGKPFTVRYDAVNAMLLNEFFKEHKTVQEQGAMIARQQKQIDALTAGLQKVSAQLEVSKAAPQTVLNNH